MGLKKKFLNIVNQPVSTCVLTTALGAGLAFGTDVFEPAPSAERKIADKNYSHDRLDPPGFYIETLQTGAEAVAIEQKNLRALARLGEEALQDNGKVPAFVKLAASCADGLIESKALSERDVAALRATYLQTPGIQQFRVEGYAEHMERLEGLKLAGGQLGVAQAEHNNALSISDSVSGDRLGRNVVLSLLFLIAGVGAAATHNHLRNKASLNALKKKRKKRKKREKKRKNASPSKTISAHGDSAKIGPYKVHGRPEDISQAVTAQNKLDNLFTPYRRTPFGMIPEKIVKQAAKIVGRAREAAMNVRAVEGPTDHLTFTREVVYDTMKAGEEPAKEVLSVFTKHKGRVPLTHNRYLSTKFTLSASPLDKYKRDIEDIGRLLRADEKKRARVEDVFEPEQEEEAAPASDAIVLRMRG